MAAVKVRNDRQRKELMAGSNEDYFADLIKG